MAASIYSVAQINSYIKNMFEQDFALRQIYVRGEVSNCKYHSSGHIYFTIKDASGVLNAVMFRSQRAGLNIRLQNGMQIVAGGSISIYERDGRYQLYAQSIRLDGVGELYRQYEARKAQLEEMGMFAPEYKQPIPPFALKIGVVTAPQGAAIRDIVNITCRRNPCVTLYLYPALVQGDQAAASIAAGINYLDELGLDCIIVGRGGGSIEDLWAFNEEETAFAIFHARTPIISAVGHETDFTIADFVADLRAPTPSAAAELAVFDYEALKSTLQVRLGQLGKAMETQLERRQALLEALSRRLQQQDPAYQLQQERKQLEFLREKLDQAMKNRMKDWEHRLQIAAGKLEALSPLKRLSGGFAYVTDKTGKPVFTAAQTVQGETLCLQFADGKVYARITDQKWNGEQDGQREENTD